MSDDEPRVCVTKSGWVLPDADIEALADEAERGYDVDWLLARRGRREPPIRRRGAPEPT
ncbi:MAG: hypothetical protein JWO37_1005 [Acidimicrobiales bacterium]|jgi:hypothetical protein|nr:hypothetical protein [Acidimicrobiales bacterium]